MSFDEATVGLKAIFTSLIEALELSDPYTRGHSDRVGALSVALGLELELSTHALEVLKDAGALHDIGKIGVSSDILNKPGKLSDDEFDAIKQHPEYGYNILKPLEQPELLDCALLHHERLDGKGYPYGRSELPLLVRITQISDIWDALTSDRPYRRAMSFSKARELMSDPKSFCFDPELLQTFLRLTRFIFPADDCNPDEMSDIMDEIKQLDSNKELCDFPHIA